MKKIIMIFISIMLVLSFTGCNLVDQKLVKESEVENLNSKILKGSINREVSKHFIIEEYPLFWALKNTGYGNKNISINLKFISDNKLKTAAENAIKKWKTALNGIVSINENSNARNYIVDGPISIDGDGLINKMNSFSAKVRNSSSTTAEYSGLNFKSSNSGKYYGKASNFVIALDPVLMERKTKEGKLYTLLHEIGHALCLQHVNINRTKIDGTTYNSIMNTANNNKEFNSITAYDIERVRIAFYPNLFTNVTHNKATFDEDTKATFIIKYIF